MQEIEEQDLLANVRRQGKLLRQSLTDKFNQHPHIGDVRGRGLLLGIELVADRESKEPFAPERMVWNAIQSAAMDSGLLCYPGFGTVDGTRGDHILLAPPFIITEAQVGEIVDKLALAIDQAIAGTA
ncbi:aminotransferase class III-fold pyridoxal phosphate-dependent enzyme [Novosphingobium sp. THN1]|uniref:aminotransferase class III-fold pyridoxal phosphate-dependent enzyme n=1 Tax=Novosphingobium sp. THN1 TaxID=1016987 RepID=UPI0021069509|nr:aminotransferase class III-fold pyridoxal phosphate-dependent enzyme [Novosphingobium sp. THN1]